jgi:hypothetical protein
MVSGESGPRDRVTVRSGAPFCPRQFQFPSTSDSTPDLTDLHKRISHRAPPITPENESIRPFNPQSEIKRPVIGWRISIFHIHEIIRIPITNPRGRNTARTVARTRSPNNEMLRIPARNRPRTTTPLRPVHHDQFNQHGQRRLPPLRHLHKHGYHSLQLPTTRQFPPAASSSPAPTAPVSRNQSTCNQMFSTPSATQIRVWTSSIEASVLIRSSVLNASSKVRRSRSLASFNTQYCWASKPVSTS